MQTYVIHLVRHGAAEGADKGQYIGHLDVDLTQEGREELLELKEVYDYPEVPVVFSSPLKRCRDTASLLYPDNQVLILDDLIEYNFGEFEGCTAEELKENEDFLKWLSGDKDAAPPHGETNQEFATRVATAFNQVVEGLLKTNITSAAIVTHGGVIMTIMSMFALPEAPMTEWATPNGNGYVVRITPSIWSQAKKMEAVALLPMYKEGFEPDPDDDTDYESMTHSSFTIDIDEMRKAQEEEEQPEKDDTLWH